jgi:hypothetical protein
MIRVLVFCLPRRRWSWCRERQCDVGFSLPAGPVDADSSAILGTESGSRSTGRSKQRLPVLLSAPTQESFVLHRSHIPTPYPVAKPVQPVGPMDGVFDRVFWVACARHTGIFYGVLLRGDVRTYGFFVRICYGVMYGHTGFSLDFDWMK